MSEEHCGREPVYLWRTFANGTRHIEARCPACKRFLGFAEQTPAAVLKADTDTASDPFRERTLWDN